MINIGLKLFKSFSKDERKYFYILIFLMFLAMLLEALSIGLIFPLLTFIINDSKEVNIFENIEFINFLNVKINFSKLLSLTNILIILFTIFVFKNTFLLYQAFLQAKFSSSLGMNKSQLLYNKYISLPYSFHVENNSGFLLRNITEEIGNYCGAVIVMMRLMTELIVLIGILVLLLLINPIITFNIILFFGLILYLYQNITKRYFLKWGEQKQNFFGERIIAIQQTFGAFKELKILNRFEKFYNIFQDKNKKLYKIDIKNETLNNAPKYLIETILVLTICLILIYFSFFKNISSSIPLLGVMAAASFRILPSINKLVTNIQELRYFNASLGLVTKEFENLNYENKNIKKPDLDISFNKEIKFDNIHFSYKKKNHI